MQKQLYLFTLAVLLTATACTDDYKLERREDKLLGTWVIEKANFKSNWALFPDNLPEFEGDAITFYDNYTCLYDDWGGALYDGDWELYIDRDNIDGESDIEFFLDIYFFDGRGREAFFWLGEVTYLTREKLTLRVLDRNGRYTFKLRKE